jgi:Mg2+ and Co2+ transporter CorA
VISVWSLESRRIEEEIERQTQSRPPEMQDVGLIVASKDAATLLKRIDRLRQKVQTIERLLRGLGHIADIITVLAFALLFAEWFGATIDGS